jgi:tetratricopeptide (TPR) repeat protein
MRRAYNKFLKFKELAELCSQIKIVPKALLLDQSFAEMCLKLIMQAGFTDSEALAIYNKEAGLLKEPYIPARVSYLLKCGHCNFISEFADEKAAMKANKCANCGKPLYKSCVSCGKTVIASAEQCPECGIVFAKAAFFDTYINAAEEFLVRQDFDEASKCLIQAQLANPGKKSKIDEVKAKIQAEEKRLGNLLDPVRNLIKGKRYQGALDELTSIIRKNPNVKAPTLEKEIKSVLAEAKKSFDAISNPSEKADKCLEILSGCVDFEPARLFLKATPPKPCFDLKVSVDKNLKQVALGWKGPQEQGVTYCVIRKQGKANVVGPVDGIALTDDCEGFSCVDKTLSPGNWYTYAVFAKRFGVYSSGVEIKAILLLEVSNFKVEQKKSDSVLLSWTLPEKSANAIITRVDRAWNSTTIAANAITSCADINFICGETYSYKAKAVYPDGVSDGVVCALTPFPEVGHFKIKETKTKESVYKITWDLSRPGIDMLLMVNGQNSRMMRSDAGGIEVEFPKNGIHTVTVKARSMSSWVESNSVIINTCSPCVIDKALSRLDEYETDSGFQANFSLQIAGEIPDGVIAFSYGVNTINQLPGSLKRIGIEEYKQQKEIKHSISTGSEEAYFVYLLTIFSNNGQEAISFPRVLKFTRPLMVSLKWSVVKGAHGSLDVKLAAHANKPITAIPELGLYVSSDRSSLTGSGDPAASKLLSFDSIALDSPKMSFVMTYDVRAAAKSMKKKQLYLFVEPAADLPAHFKILHDTGFNGRI